MKALFDVRTCENCGASLSWLRKDITKEIDKLPDWPSTVKAYGVDCCGKPVMNNDQYAGHFYLEVNED